MADYPNESEEDWTEFQEEQRDRQEDMWDEMDSSTQGGYPTQKKPENLFSLFKDVWKAKDSTKVANLDPKLELGDLGLSVRHCQKIAYASEILNEKNVANYFDTLGEITLATSMSKKGWFAELFVSTKKFAQKGNLQNLQGAEKKEGWRIFGKSKETTNTEQ
jgi:hypothetical protein